MRKFFINSSPLVIVLSSLIIFSALAYVLYSRYFSNIFFDVAIFFFGSFFILKEFSLYLNRVRALFFKEGDRVIIVQRGKKHEYGNFERLIDSPEDWMPDDLKSMLKKEVLEKKLPMAVISQRGGLALTTTVRLIMVECNG